MRECIPAAGVKGELLRWFGQPFAQAVSLNSPAPVRR